MIRQIPGQVKVGFAVTIQNTTGVKSIVPIDPKEISNQIEFTSKDIKPDAVKIVLMMYLL